MFLKSNPDKSHLLAGDEDNLEISIGDVTIKNSKEEKLLGITVSSDFSITKHVSNLCRKFSKKLHAFPRISHFMSLHKRRNVMKAFLEFEFGYCPLVWIFHGHVFNGTETIRYRAQKTWETVPEHVEKCRSLMEFKIKIKT